MTKNKSHKNAKRIRTKLFTLLASETLQSEDISVRISQLGGVFFRFAQSSCSFACVQTIGKEMLRSRQNRKKAKKETNTHTNKRIVLKLHLLHFRFPPNFCQAKQTFWARLKPKAVRHEYT